MRFTSPMAAGPATCGTPPAVLPLRGPGAVVRDEASLAAVERPAGRGLPSGVTRCRGTVRQSIRFCLLLSAYCLLLIGCASSKPLMAVAVPVVDLRATPHTSAQPNVHDLAQETQLLYGEQVRIMKKEKEQDGWVYVEAVEQPEFSHAKRWQGYPGWLPTSALLRWQPLLSPNIVVVERWASSWTDGHALTPAPWHFAMGTRLRGTNFGDHLWRIELLDGSMVWIRYTAARRLHDLAALDTMQRRQLIIRNALELLGDPYFWGGRSPYTDIVKHQVTGVDCSGLINIAYRAAGVDVPRDAHEQFLRARSIATLQPADLIFLSERESPQRIVHVMLYAGDGQIIEGPGTGQLVRRIALEERLGHSLGQTVSFGTYLP